MLKNLTLVISKLYYKGIPEFYTSFMLYINIYALLIVLTKCYITVSEKMLTKDNI